ACPETDAAALESAAASQRTVLPSRFMRSAALLHRHEVALGRSGLDLSRAGDLLLRLEDHLLPLRQPARGARKGEQDRGHLDREARRLVDAARVAVDVGIEIAVFEVLLVERAPLELHRDVDQGIPAGDLEDLLGRALDDARPRVVRLVHAVA